MRRAFAAKKIKLRIYNAAWGPGEAASDLLKNGADARRFDHHFTQRTIKIIFDGALGSRGAALLDPYTDQPDTSGYFRQKPEELSPMFEEALRRGIQVETHAIGDRANRIILDLYEKAFKAVPPDERKIRDPRWRVEHAQILNPARPSAFRKARRHSFDATVARDQRFVFRAGATGHGSARRRLRHGRAFSRAARHLRAAPMRRSNAANR